MRQDDVAFNLHQSTIQRVLDGMHREFNDREQRLRERSVHSNIHHTVP